MAESRNRKALRIWFGIIAAGVVLGLAWWEARERQPPHPSAEPSLGTESHSPAPVVPAPAGGPIESASTSIPAGEEQTPGDLYQSDAPPLVFPTLEQVREEVKSDPHATPPSLLKFARDLAPQMEEALKSTEPKVVKRMAFALKACALSTSENALPQVQALCISNWRRLVEVREKEVPGLREELRQAESRIPAEAQRLIDASNAMLKPAGE